MTHVPRDAQGFLLLTLPQVQVRQIFQGQRLPLATGDLLLECLALPTDATANLTSPGGQVVRPNPFSDPPPPHLDLYLILKAGGFELCLVPGIKMKRSPGFSSERLDRDVTFTIPSSNSKDAFVEIVLPKPLNEEDEQDLETLEILFKQYGSLDVPNEFVNRDIPGHGLIDTTATTTTSSTTSTPTTATPTEPSSPAPKFTEGKKPPPPIPPRPGMRHSTSGGRFVLVDESTGQVLGELDQSLQVEEGHRVQGTANPSEPVVVDFGQLESGYATTISVKTVDESDLQSDWILKSAHYLSKGILTLGSTYKSGVTGAAEFYTKNTKPGTEPVKLSRGTKEGIRQVHNVSAKGLKVTRKSLGVVQDAIGGVINKAATAGFQEYDEFKRTNTPPGSNLPSRRSSMVSGSGAGSGSASGQAQGYMDDKSPPSPPSYTAQGNETPPPAKKQKGFWLRVLTAAEVVGTSIEATTANLVESTTSAAATAAGHKYGPEAERAAQLLGGSVHNVALVYVDVRGVGRKTLIKSGKKGMKGVIKTRLESGEEVILKPEGEGEIQLAHGGKVSQDVTVQLDKPSVGTSTALHGPGERANLQRRLESLALDEKKKAM